MLLVPGIVHARDHLRHLVALFRDLPDDEVVLVVAGDGEDEVRRPRDARPLEHEELSGIAEQRARPELFLERLEPRTALLDERHLVAHVEERARDVGADLAAAGDDHVHRRLLATRHRSAPRAARRKRGRGR